MLFIKMLQSWELDSGSNYRPRRPHVLGEMRKLFEISQLSVSLSQVKDCNLLNRKRG